MDKEQIQILALTSIMTVAVYVGTILFLIQPDIQEKSKLDGVISSISKEIKTNKGIANRMDAVMASIESAEKKIEEFKKTVTTTSEFRFFKETLRDIGKEHNISIKRDRTKEIEDDKKTVFKDDPQYLEKIIDLNIQSSYHEFGEFLNRIEKTTPFRKVTSFKITKSGSSRDQKKNVLTINLQILSLMFDGAT